MNPPEVMMKAPGFYFFGRGESKGPIGRIASRKRKNGTRGAVLA